VRGDGLEVVVTGVAHLCGQLRAELPHQLGDALTEKRFLNPGVSRNLRILILSEGAVGRVCDLREGEDAVELEALKAEVVRDESCKADGGGELPRRRPELLFSLHQ
jgi:hypothetical protein